MELSELINKYIEGARTYFPELDFSSSFSIYSGEKPSSAKFEFGKHDSAIKKSLYRIDSGKSFIHYTSIEALFNILNSAKLRLYNLYNLNDPKEFEYALSNVGISIKDFDFELFKRSIFLTSFCTYDMELNDEDYNMWRLYGDNGNGVGLVFEVENYEDNWNDVHFGKVQYGKSNPSFELLIKFITYHQSFNQEYNILQNYPLWIPIMCMLHKHEIWKIENETRLFTFCPFDKYNFDSTPYIKNYLMYKEINHTINKKGLKVAYTTLPLDLDNIKNEFTSKLKEIEGGAESLFSSFPNEKNYTRI